MGWREEKDALIKTKKDLLLKMGTNGLTHEGQQQIDAIDAALEKLANPPYCKIREDLQQEIRTNEIAVLQQNSIGAPAGFQLKHLEESQSRLKAHIAEHGCA